MRKIVNSARRNLLVRTGILFLLLIGTIIAAGAQARPDFSGQWKQDNDRSLPKRNGNVTLRIEHHDPEFTVETTIARASGAARHALQQYTTDGKVSISTGADGDEFHTSITWKNSNLVFSIEEHEDGRLIRSKETWSMIEDGATLEKIREYPDGEKQSLFFRRIPMSSADGRGASAEVSEK